MTTDTAPIFTAALGMPEPLRADLAAKLIASLDETEVRRRTPDEWAAIIKERSDAIDRGDAVLLDGGEVIANIRARLQARQTP